VVTPASDLSQWCYFKATKIGPIALAKDAKTDGDNLPGLIKQEGALQLDSLHARSIQKAYAERISWRSKQVSKI